MSLSRDQRKQECLIRQAQFRLKASIQEIDYQHPRNITPSQVAQLAQGEWINRAQNVLLTGPCGSGKTYLASVHWGTMPACMAIAYATTDYHG